MNIKTIRAVQLNLPRPQPKTPARRPSWNQSAPRALPLNKYPEFSHLPGALPGLGGGAVWVQVMAEDGTWGLGQCSFGRPVAAVVDDIFMPLLVGRDCFATVMVSRRAPRLAPRA